MSQHTDPTDASVVAADDQYNDGTELTPEEMAELDDRIAEIEDGVPGIDHEEVMRQLDEMLAEHERRSAR